jgi:hypothetical protein
MIGALLMALSGVVGFLIGAQRTSDECLGAVNDGRFTVQQVESADRLLAQGLTDEARDALGIVLENASAFEVRRGDCDDNPSAPF